MEENFSAVADSAEKISPDQLRDNTNINQDGDEGEAYLHQIALQTGDSEVGNREDQSAESDPHSGFIVSSQTDASPIQRIDAGVDIMANSNQNLVAAAFQALGDNFTESVEICRSRIERLFMGKPLQPADVSRIIILMLGRVSSEMSEAVPWNTSVFVAAVKEISPNINWTTVVECLDHQLFTVRNSNGLQFVTNVISAALEGKPFPVEKLYNPWTVNKAGHLSWLTSIISHPAVFNLLEHHHTLANVQCLKVVPDETDREVLIWRCKELVDVLFRLGENTMLSSIVFTLFRNPGPIQLCPDVFGLTIVQLSSPLTQFRQHVLKQVVNQLIAGHANVVPVLNFVWNCDSNADVLRQLILSCFTGYYLADDQNRLTRILEIAHELKPNGLGELFNLTQYTFVIDLACLAARRDFLKLDKFMDDKLTEIGEAFAQHLSMFLKRRVSGPSNPMPTEIVQTIYSALHSRAHYMSWLTADLQYIQQCRMNGTNTQYGQNGSRTGTGAAVQPNWGMPVPNSGVSGYRASAQEAPTPMDFRPVGNDPGHVGVPQMLANNYTNDDDLSTALFSESVQDDANQFFQKIYDCNNPLPVHELLKTMKEFSSSNNPRDRELLACLLKNLFDEFKFFAEYPEKVLRITAKVYGGIIREGIVVHMRFATAIRKILKALQAPQTTLLNSFGMVAIQECRACLYQYPRICQFIMGFECFRWMDASLRDYITYGAKDSLPPSHNATAHAEQSIGSVDNLRGTPQRFPPSGMRFAPGQSGTSSIMNVTNVDILVASTERDGQNINPPDSAVVERVAFLCNNLSSSNLPVKCDELRDIMRSQDDNFTMWLAQYIVIRRIPIEQNFQNLYNNLLISLSDADLDSSVLNETYRNIRILLKSDKRHAASNFGDRQLLKNLGLWLGTITIARDVPILFTDLNLKGLLVDAFFLGQHELLYVVPFITKVLSATAKSTIFTPQCTWIYAIIRVLAEIHHEPDLQLNLKFEIEVMCKELQLDPQTIELTGVLKDTTRLPSLYPPRTSVVPSPVSNHGFPSAYRPPETTDAPAPATRPTSFPQSAAHQFNGAAPSMGLPSTTTPNAGFPSASYPTPVPHQQPLYHQQPHQQPIQQRAQQNYSVQGPMQSFGQNGQYGYSGGEQGTPSELATPQHTEQLAADISNAAYYSFLKPFIQPSVTEAIRDLLGGIANRSIGVSITATTALCRKDFAGNPDENQLKLAARQMMQSMTAGMSAITCRDPLSQSIQAHMREACKGQYPHELPKGLQDAIQTVSENHIDAATRIIVKSAIEKAMLEIDAALAEDFKYRKQCRENGVPFKPDVQLMTLNAKIPDILKAPTSAFDESHFRVYEEFLKIGDQSAELLNLVTNDMVRTSSVSSQYVRPAAYYDQDHLSKADVTQRAAANFQQAAAPNDGRNADEFQTKAENILREWISYSRFPAYQRDPQNAFMYIVQLMKKSGVLSTDEMVSKFFQICMSICVDVAYRLIRNETAANASMNVISSSRHRCNMTLDAFAKLCCLISKLGPEGDARLNILRRILLILQQALLKDHDNRKEEFNGLPFMRIFLKMFVELVAEDAAIDVEPLNCFFEVLKNTHPGRCPGFVFHWLEIIGHRVVIERFFRRADSSACYIQLLRKHLQFVAPFLRSAAIPQNIQLIYRGTVRIIFVVVHDFPDVFAENYYHLVDVIPPNCVQLRNIILSAYPRDTTIPDPFTLNTENVENMPEMNENPRNHHEMCNILDHNICARLDQYLQHRLAIDLLSEVPALLMVNPTTACKYNFTTVNNVVMHVGALAIDSIHERRLRVGPGTVANTAFMDVFQHLVVSLCNQGRYLLFNAMVNQLRYPNSHTNYFSCTLLYLFQEAHAPEVQEQIARILLERLLSQKPHPWGLLVTFLELIRNKEHNFWSHEFVRCAPEIEQLLLKIARFN